MPSGAPALIVSLSATSLPPRSTKPSPTSTPPSPSSEPTQQQGHDRHHTGCPILCSPIAKGGLSRSARPPSPTNNHQLLFGLRVHIFLVPRRLDRLQNSLIRLRRIAHKPRQLHHPLVQIGKSHRVRVRLRKHLLQLNPNLLGIRPIQLARHRSLPRSLVVGANRAPPRDYKQETTRSQSSMAPSSIPRWSASQLRRDLKRPKCSTAPPLARPSPTHP